jgi:hypothetical protein
VETLLTIIFILLKIVAMLVPLLTVRGVSDLR